MKDIFPSINFALGMGVVVYLVGYLHLPTLPLLLIQVVCGAVIYIAESAVLKLDPYTYLLEIIKPMLQKRRKV